MSCIFDTYEQLMLDRINKALRHEEFVHLENNEWNDLYETYFLNIYAQITNLTSFKYVFCEYKTFEPVTLHIDPKQCATTEEPSVLHAISVPFLKWIFTVQDTKRVDVVDSCSFKMPSIFPLTDNLDTAQTPNLSRMLNGFVSNALVAFYVYADHAAYHYNEFMRTGNADYEHKNIRNRSSDITAKEVKYVHDLVSSKPNTAIVNYLKPHSDLSVESQENVNSFTNISYGDLLKR